LFACADAAIQAGQAKRLLRLSYLDEAGDRGILLEGEFQAAHAAVDQHDGADDHGGGEEHVERDDFIGEEPAQQDGDDGVDVGVGGDEGG
jgi:hypothetical protein